MRLLVPLFLSLLTSCTSAPVVSDLAQEFGPNKILLYAELRDATYGWISVSPAPSRIVGVYYRNSNGFEALYDAVGQIIEANEAGQYKAVTAVVTGRWIEEHGRTMFWITSAKDIDIVDLPPGLITTWKAASKLPE